MSTGFLWHKVEPNQEFQGLVCEVANVLPAKFLEDSFRDGHGNLITLSPYLCSSNHIKHVVRE